MLPHTDLFYTLDYNLIVLYFVAHFFPSIIYWEFFQISLLSLLYNAILFLLSLFFLPFFGTRYSSHILFPALVLEASIFSKKSWFLVLKSGIRNHNLNVKWAHCCWRVLTSGNSQLREKICGHANMCICTYL